jgi:hypothetical protein
VWRYSLSTMMVRGFTVCGCPSALRKNRLAASASRLAESRKSITLVAAVDRPIQVHPAALHPHIGPSRHTKVCTRPGQRRKFATEPDNLLESRPPGQPTLIPLPFPASLYFLFLISIDLKSKPT